MADKTGNTSKKLSYVKNDYMRTRPEEIVNPYPITTRRSQLADFSAGLGHNVIKSVSLKRLLEGYKRLRRRLGLPLSSVFGVECSSEYTLTSTRILEYSPKQFFIA